MKDLFREIRWFRALLAGVGALLTSWVIVFLIIFGYAAKLGFEAKGQPDQEAIQAFAEDTGPVAGPVAAIVMTLLAAAWAARKTTSPHINGLTVGAGVAVVLLLMGGSLSLGSIGVGLLAMGAGWAGGVAGGWLSPGIAAAQTSRDD